LRERFKDEKAGAGTRGRSLAEVRRAAEEIVW